MNFLMRAAFVLGGIFLGINLINYFVLGHTGDYLPGGQRMGEWKEAKIREACYPALESPERDELLPKLTSNQHRVGWRELNRAINAALIQDTSNGRLIKADFGWTVPAAMKPLLDRYKGTTDNCPRA